jgi:hypothetical protein
MPRSERQLLIREQSDLKKVHRARHGCSERIN